MATIEIALLSEHLDESQIEAMLSAIADETTVVLDSGSDEDSIVVDSSIDDDLFVDFLGHLDANDLDADIYIPLDFEEVVEIGEFKIGSTHALQLVLDNLRDDFFVEADEDDDEEEDLVGNEFDVEDGEAEDDDGGLDEMGTEFSDGESYGHDDSSDIDAKDEQLRHIWKVVHRAAKESIEAKLALVFHT